MAAGGELLSLAATIVGLAGIAGVVWAVFRVKGTQATIDLLEQSVRIERQEREALGERCTRIEAELQARIIVLTDEFANIIAQAVVDAVKEKL